MEDAMKRLQLAADLSEGTAAADESLPHAARVAEACSSWGVTAELKSHQAEGVAWLIRRYARGVNVILGDEMGLGKTLQSVALLSYLVSEKRCSGPFLIISPLSVTEGWASELAKFSPNLRVLEYLGDKDHRDSLRETVCLHVNKQQLQSRGDPVLQFDVLLTTYELAVLDAKFLSKFRWRYAIVDEAQRLKNPSTKLYQVLQGEYMIPRRLLLTGTPVQNNLSELWSLLHFCMPKVFDDLNTFLEAFGSAATTQDISESGEDTEQVTETPKGPLELLRRVLGAFMLRRTKSALVQAKALVLQPVAEVTVYAPLVPVQKKVYVSVLRKEAPRIAGHEDDSTSKQSLNNIVIQLRKACSHPYLFDGVEPEPFVEGEHLVQASGKLVLLDMILKRLHSGGHNVLIYAQMQRTLDILQDYLQFRGYTYERLDGSIRAEERFAAVRSFGGQKRENDDSDAAVFVFLLTTRAGGVGLNLVAADTVIFYEQDWNPQADKQALQRAHRIGQLRPVLAINLIVENTFEEVIRQRAISKLQLVDNVIGRDIADEQLLDKADLRSAIVFGLNKILSHPDETHPDKSGGLGAELVKVVDRALDQRPNSDSTDPDSMDDNLAAVKNKPTANAQEEAEQLVHLFKEDEGNNSADLSALKSLQKNLEHGTGDAAGQENGGGRRSRQERPSDPTEATEEAAARKKRKKDDARHSLWTSLGYTSLSVSEPDRAVDDDARVDEDDNEYIHQLVGDCTKPGLADEQNGIILWSVDDSGMWGSGGVFTAIEHLSKTIPEAFEAAHEADDLHLGDLHLIAVPESSAGCDEKEQPRSAHLWVALAVVQTFDRRRKVPRSGVSFVDLEVCIKKVAASAARLSASVHMPRIQADDGWYMVERLLRKYAMMYGVHFHVYYFKRRGD